MAGRLVIIGGGEDKSGKCLILRHYLQLAGGRDARLAVITAASAEGEAVGEEYRAVFRRLGAAEVDVMNITDRQQANADWLLDKLAKATGAFFTGGDQLRITALMGGTLLFDTLYRRWQEGLVLAGTSAGASAMSSTMIVGGRGSDTAKREMIHMSPGLGFLPAAVIDQHFAQRGRIMRLLAAISQNPEMLGIGIDEDTALVLDGNTAEVRGSGTVTLVDGRGIEHTSASDSETNDPLALWNVCLHVLPAGYRFQIDRRLPLLPA